MPTGLRNIFKLGSDSDGLVMFSIIAVLLFIAIKRHIIVARPFLNNTFYWILIFYLILIMHTLSAFLFNQEFIWIKWSLSVLITAPILIAALILGDLINGVDEIEFDSFLRFMFYFMLFVGYIGSISFSNESGAGKPMIFFSEPSHFALVFTPLMAYFCVTTKNYKKITFFAVLILGFLAQNLTIFIGIFLVVSLYTRWKNLLVFTFLIIGTLLFYEYNQEHYSYYLDRLSFVNGVEETSNLTALSFLQGWQFAVESIRNYFPFGLGFQQLGFVDLSATATEKLALMGYDLNKNDGSFLASKIISEFGLLGIFLIAAYLLTFTYNFFNLRKKITDRDIDYLSKKTIFYNLIYMSFSLTLFVRGSGYFSTATFFFLIALIQLRFAKLELKLHRHYIN